MEHAHVEAVPRLQGSNEGKKMRRIRERKTLEMEVPGIGKKLK